MNKKGLYWLLPLRSIVFIIFFLTAAWLTKKNVDEISSIWSFSASIINILFILLLIWVSKKNGMSYKELINYEKGKSKFSHVVIMSVIIIVIGMGGMFLAGFLCYKTMMPYCSLVMIRPIPAVLAVINIFLLPVSTTLAEDGLYLGCGVAVIKNKIASILIPAFFYALQHCFIPVLLDPIYILYRFISFLPCTILLCAYYQEKKDPVPVMVGHALIDVATVMQIAATSLIPGFYENMCSML